MRSRINALLLALVLAQAVALLTLTLAPYHPVYYDQAQRSDESTKPHAEQNKPAKSFGERLSIIWDRTWDDPIALFTFVLALSTIGLWVATGGLYFAGRQAIKETRRIGEAQVRAYVSIKSATIEFMLDASIPLVRFIASNSGQSPARNFLWNVTLQYPGPSISRETVFYEKWLTTTGMDIPAASDAHPEGALVPMPAKTYIEPIAGILNTVVRLKIDFRYTDVFERNWFGEAYFSGVMKKRPPGIPISLMEINASPWTAQISPMPRPPDWDDIRISQLAENRSNEQSK